MGCSPPGSSVHGVLQARILEGVAISLWSPAEFLLAGCFSSLFIPYQEMEAEESFFSKNLQAYTVPRSSWICDGSIKKKKVSNATSKSCFWNVLFVWVSSVPQSCTMNRSTSGLPVHHQLPEFTQTQVHRVGDAIQSSHLLSSPSPPAPNPSQHHGLFQWVSSSLECQ